MTMGSVAFLEPPAVIPLNGRLLAEEARDCSDSRSEEAAPVVRYAAAVQVKKGEDYWLAKPSLEKSSLPGVSVFGVFDGHNGSKAAEFTRERLLEHVLGAMPPRHSREEWIAALPQAMVIGFLKTDAEFTAAEKMSGTTSTLVMVDEWTLTVAAVGDSRCVLETQGSGVVQLTEDHRLEDNHAECRRIITSGGQVGRLSTADGDEVGPLRCWPGGLCLSRSIGDADVGKFVVPIPQVRQIKLPPCGGRVIVCSDGVWDAVPNEKVARKARGLSTQEAASQIVKEAIRSRGLRDDITCLVIDILPPMSGPDLVPVIKQKQKSSLKRMFSSKKTRDADKAAAAEARAAGSIEEIVNEGSAEILDHLLDSMDGSVHAGNSILCTNCRVDLTPGGLSIHAGNFFGGGGAPWKGPFYCNSCKAQRVAKSNGVAG